MQCPFDVVAFDLDGTLADTSADLAAALNHALRALGRPIVPPDAARSLVGHGARALLRRGLAENGAAPEDLVEAGFPIFIDHYAEHICDGTRPYPGAAAALDAIAAAGARVALCTNKPEALTRALLDALGWDRRFAAAVGGDTLPLRKPDPAPLVAAIARADGGRAAFVGDSTADADTARAARLPFIAVTFGFDDLPVEALGADAAIDSFDGLMPALLSVRSGP
jgi:phosphoglycolate phosphatase